MKPISYVTGADRGLGLGLVQVLLEKGYKVYAGSYLPEQDELRKLSREHPNDVIVLPLDVSSEESVKQAREVIAAETNVLNLLINNAGIAQDRSGTILEPQYYEDIRALYEINTLGPLRVTQSVIDLLLNADRKMLVNISSVAGSVQELVRIQQYGYTMSKAALNMQSKMIHNHFKDQGLKVLVVHPGWMRSLLFGDIERMKDAPFEPIQSARNIVKLTETETEINEDIYMDHEGNRLPW
ncbi:SDR family NAD(P)-dependent oxidoreductase [Paenibacillus piri]|uniref:SDR family NAD(P)-dependent oxidoreductase n=1 Tax=Paenibacillus piri TaxID=2547395 RepID=A0A4R5K850_9BACL|nr:SDR family NAD(P)-dependent oxidoreductase [Paenibacillus piri]TDF89190.1 SDR family NAD(P)-dependent oxidoreductase [Paenibacillus piri]